MPSVWFDVPFAAAPPTRSRTSSRQGDGALKEWSTCHCSAIAGVRFPGGIRENTVFGRCSPAVPGWRRRASGLPQLRPGAADERRAFMSSSPPGDSPMIMTGALGFPRAKTARRAPACFNAAAVERRDGVCQWFEAPPPLQPERAPYPYPPVSGDGRRQRLVGGTGLCARGQWGSCPRRRLCAHPVRRLVRLRAVSTPQSAQKAE